MLPSIGQGFFLVLTDDGSHTSSVAGIDYVNSTFLSGRQLSDGNIRIQHRQTGFPIQGVKVDVGDTETESGDDGIVLMKAGTSYSPLWASQDGDTLKLGARYRPRNHPNRDTVTRIVFYTDRGIYRPGQTVKFKGILMQRWGKNSLVVPGFR